MPLQLLIKNGRCVNAGGVFPADIGVENGKICIIDKNIDLPAEKTINAKGNYVFPGLIDAHVHLPWPSARASSVDDYASGSKAAVCGGVTTTIEYVVPGQDGNLLPALEHQMQEAQRFAFSDFAFHSIVNRVTPETIAQMAAVVERGVVSFKVYTAYDGFRLGDDEVLEILQAAKRLNCLVCFHAEDGLVINFATRNLVENHQIDISYYPDAHPKAVDVEATYRMLHYAKYIGARTHIVHVNTAEAAQLIGAARRQGYPISGETCTQYLMFTEDVYRSGKQEAHYFVCAPLMRSEEDRQGLWQAISSDDLQMMASDHCPYTSSQKLEGVGDFRKVPGGLAGLETSLPLVYTYGVHAGRFPVERLVELMSTNPARLFNLHPQKGAIAAGADADFVIFDPSPRWKIDFARLHSNTDHTVYQDIEVVGKPVATILRGEVVAENGEVVAQKPAGKYITRPVYA